MKIVFFGTPDYVLPILETLHKTFKKRSGESSITAVVTNSPKQAGRKKILTYSPVDNWAHKKGVPIIFDSMNLIKEKIEADIGILASYGAIIPKKVLDYFPNGILNIHPSLLPLWRGASPIQATIISGEKISGVTIIRLDEKLDHGPIISQFKEEIGEADTTDTLRRRLFERSAEVIITLLPAYLSGKIKPRPQNEKEATFTRQLKKEDAFIHPKFLQAALDGKTLEEDWKIPFIRNFTINHSLSTIHRFILAMHPWPIAWTYVQIGKGQEEKGKRIKILESHLETQPVSKLILDEIQLEGKNPVSWTQFKEAYNTAIFE